MSAGTDALKSLLTRVGEATGGDRELDALIEIIARKTEAFRVLPDPRHHAVWTPMPGFKGAVESQGTRYAVEPFTSSVDAALALCERVLPGVMGSAIISFGGSDRRQNVRLYGPDPEMNVIGSGDAKTPALAIIAACLRALIEKGEQL